MGSGVSPSVPVPIKVDVEDTMDFLFVVVEGACVDLGFDGVAEDDFDFNIVDVAVGPVLAVLVSVFVRWCFFVELVVSSE